MDTYNLPGPDWFSHNIATWQELFRSHGSPRAILEIGAYEGRATTWMVENLLAQGGEIVVVDHWRGSSDREAPAGSEVEARFDANMELARRRFPAARIVKLRDDSRVALPRLLAEGRGAGFDFVYVDGGHEAPQVLHDAVLGFELLRAGGLIAFDDYGWRRFADVNDNPKVAIDAFSNVFWKRLALLSGGYQQVFRKES